MSVAAAVITGAGGGAAKATDEKTQASTRQTDFRWLFIMADPLWAARAAMPGRRTARCRCRWPRGEKPSSRDRHLWLWLGHKLALPPGAQYRRSRECDADAGCQACAAPRSVHPL